MSIPLSFQKQEARSGPVMIFFAGRVGDTLSIDGQEVGQLPVRTQLREGSHTFAVDGEVGRQVIERDVTLKAAGTTMLHLDR